jgi:hypothetical protein
LILKSYLELNSCSLTHIDLVGLNKYGFEGDLQGGNSLSMCAIFKGELRLSPGNVFALPVPQEYPVVA